MAVDLEERDSVPRGTANVSCTSFKAAWLCKVSVDGRFHLTWRRTGGAGFVGNIISTSGFRADIDTSTVHLVPRLRSYSRVQATEETHLYR